MAANGIGALRKLPRLWRAYAHMDFLWITRDFRFFSMCLLADLTACFSSIVAVYLLAERFDGLGHWSKFQVIFMLGYAASVTGVMNTFFSFNILHISRRLGRGQLDHTLIQPQPVWLSLLTEGFMPFSGSAPLLTGMGLMAYAATRLGLPLSSPGWLLMTAGQLASSCAVLVAFAYLTGSLAFWAPRGAEEMCSLTVRILTSLRSFPLDGVRATLSLLLLSILPVGFIAWYPCRYLLGIHPSPAGAALTPLAAFIMSMLAAAAFWRGFKHYGETGSQRYLDMGHRR